MTFHSLSLIFLFDLLTFHRLKLFPAILLLVLDAKKKKKDEKTLYGQNLFIYTLSVFWMQISIHLLKRPKSGIP